MNQAIAPQKARRFGRGQTGTEWKRKMQSLALRISKRLNRRDRSGSPMRRRG